LESNPVPGVSAGPYRASRGEALLKHVLLAYVVALLLVGLVGVPCRGADAQAVGSDDPTLLFGVHMWEGHRLLQQGQQALAADAFLTATRYSRWSPYPHFMLARVYARRSLMDSLLEYGAGIKMFAADFASQSVVASNLVICLLLAIALSIYVAVGVILARHAKTLWCSVFLTYSPTLGENCVRLLAAIFIGTLVVLISGLSPVAAVTWVALVGCGLSWRYASRSERRVMICFAAFLVLLVPAVNLTSQLVSTQHPDSPTKIAALGGATTEAELIRLAELRDLPPEKDPVGEFTRGLVDLKRENYLGAIDHFNTAAIGSSSHAAVLNNIGLALHGLGRYAEAKTKFEESLRFAPSEALIHYNYSQTLNALLFFDMAQDHLAMASGLDFDLTRSLVTAGDKPVMVPMSLDANVLWGLAAHPANRMFNLTYHPIEAGWVGLAVVAALTALGFFLVRKARQPARCDICGGLLKARVAKRKRRDLLCRQCRAIKQANADSNDRLEKALEERVASLSTRRTLTRIALGLAIPGSTHHLLGSRARGFLFSAVVFTALALAASGGGPLKPLPRFDLDGTAAWAIILLIAVYAVYAWRAIKLVLGAPERTGQ
jgi:hypothetical protein